jgi:hypothetical protein
VQGARCTAIIASSKSREQLIHKLFLTLEENLLWHSCHLIPQGMEPLFVVIRSKSEMIAYAHRRARWRSLHGIEFYWTTFFQKNYSDFLRKAKAALHDHAWAAHDAKWAAPAWPDKKPPQSFQ